MKFLKLLLILLVIGGAIFLSGKRDVSEIRVENPIENLAESIESNSTKTQLLTPPNSKILQSDYHVFQTFNNCGPSALSMALYYYGINKSQQELGKELRPYQLASGDNDDKSVTLAELAEKSKDFGLTPFHRPNGNIDTIKLFITYDIPVITRTWLKENEDIGHFRIVKGYDDLSKELIQDDSYEGKNLKFSYDMFSRLWKKFNYEYLVLIPEDKVEIAKAILGEEADEKTSWENAVENAEEQLIEDPDDVYARFNLSIALSHMGEHERAVAEFEKVETRLSFRTLWYQIEPIESYFILQNYDRVFEITDKILTTGNRAYSELYYIRGQVFLKQGDKDLAKAEFEKAVQYKNNYEPALEALKNL